MTTLDLELIMMLQVAGVLQWLTVPMAPGFPSRSLSLNIFRCLFLLLFLSHIHASMFP